MILKVPNIKDLHSTIFILKQALFKLSISVPFIFTFYNIYIKTLSSACSLVALFQFTFYNIYIKTRNEKGTIYISSRFTFYNIYIKTKELLTN